MNKPTMTKERLIKIKEWRELYGAGSNVVLPAEEAEELARVALAVTGAEPVYQWRERHDEGDLWEDCTKEQYDGFAKHSECEARVLYTAQPASAVPVEMTIETLPEDIKNLPATTAVIWMNAWNACRATMLNHSEYGRDMVKPVSQPYKLPDNSFTSDELEMMAHGVNPQANAYRELLTFRRNSPVIPDGWVACSERMPPIGVPVITCCGDVVQYAAYSWDGKDWQDWYEEYEKLPANTFTHWHPRPAAPQQEGR